MLETKTLQEITEKVIDICRAARQNKIMPIQESAVLGIQHKDESGRNFVTKADLETEIYLKEHLHKIVPEASFIAEESELNLNRSGLNWIVDPIDGTTNFMHNAPPYCISVALAKDDDVLLGVVLELSMNECFFAWKNGGAFSDSNRLNVSSNPSLTSSLLTTGFPYEQTECFDDWISLFGKLTRKTQGVRRYGAAAVDLCYVAAGRLDGYYEFNLNPWDVAAGSIIAKEAGATLSDFFEGQDYLFGETLICTNGLIHKELTEQISEFASKHAHYLKRV